MTSYKYLKVKKSDGIARITFDRPKHNVLNIDMMAEFTTELDMLQADVALKCIVILGEGPNWCAGVEVADHKPEMAPDMIAAFNSIFESIEKIEVPIIAGVHGACLGGGMEVAIACDIVVAAKSARMASILAFLKRLNLTGLALSLSNNFLRSSSGRLSTSS